MLFQAGHSFGLQYNSELSLNDVFGNGIYVCARYTLNLGNFSYQWIPESIEAWWSWCPTCHVLWIDPRHPTSQRPSHFDGIHLLTTKLKNFVLNNVSIYN